MADDAAGAVRRTPRPTPELEMIYGTARTDPIGTVREHDDGTTAVKVSMGDDSTKGQHVWCLMTCKLEVRWLHHYDVAEWAVLAAPEKRPVVLLRAEDCACRYGDDCPHGPEPVDALDLALWLHAEAKHQHVELLAQRDSWWDHVGREQSKVTAERDALQARIDAALALMDYWDAHGGSIPQGHRLRAVLQGDQPAEPDERLAGMARPAEGVQLIADAFGIAPAEAAAQLRDAIRAAARSDLDEPTGEADRG